MKEFRSSLTALFLAFGLLIPISSTGLVLCIGADGHIALEPARNSRCTTPMASTSTPAQQITPLPSQLDHCGPCIDVWLSTSKSDEQQMFSAPSAWPKLAAPVLALVAVVMPVHVEPPQPYCVLPPASRANTLLALRTVLLLL